MRKHLSPSAFALLISCFVLASQSFAEDLSLTEASVQQGVVVAAGTGMGIFQDIQVPVNEIAGVRGDGKMPGVENQNHMGLMLQGELGYQWQRHSMTYRLGLEGMQARSTSGPAATQSSSYTRYDVGGQASYRINPIWQMGTTLGYRRSAFNNVSTGHFIDSVMTGVNTSLSITPTWVSMVEVELAPLSNFYYNSGKGFSGHRFENSQTSLANYRLLSKHQLNLATWLTFGLAQEVAQVQIDDLSEYNEFGLSVTPTREASRTYDLATTVLSIGFDKRF